LVTKLIIELTEDEQAKRDRRLLKKEELSREHSKILTEIETHERASVNLALKNVYILGHVTRFEKKLEKRIKDQEKEIERLCEFHYGNFVVAINMLTKIEVLLLIIIINHNYVIDRAMRPNW